VAIPDGTHAAALAGVGMNPDRAIALISPSRRCRPAARHLAAAARREPPPAATPTAADTALPTAV
jgi:hypothetical protein